MSSEGWAVQCCALQGQVGDVDGRTWWKVLVVCWRTVFSECLWWPCSFLCGFFYGLYWVFEHLLIISMLKPVRQLWGRLLSLLWAEGFGAQGLRVGVVSAELGRCDVGLLQRSSEDSFPWHHETCPLHAIQMLHLLWARTVSLLFWVIFTLHSAELGELFEDVLVNRVWKTVAQNRVTSSGLGLFIKSFGVLYFLSSTNLVSKANVIYGFVLCSCETCRILI